MSTRSREAKRARRWRAASAARRARLRANQAGPRPTLEQVAAALNAGRFMWCEDMETRIARELAAYDRAHPVRVPYARGYHRKHKWSPK